MAVFILDNFQRVCQVLEDYAFFFGFLYFNHICRHFIFGSSVDIVNFLCTQSYRCSAGVHGSISAADDGNFVAQFDFFVSYYFSQEVNTADNALCIFSLASYACGHPCADSKENCIIIASDGFKRNVNSYFCVCNDFSTHSFNGEYFFVQYSFRKSVFRNSVTKHTTCFRHCFENGYVVSHLSQEVSCR